jgi:hypothetical protein
VNRALLIGALALGALLGALVPSALAYGGVPTAAQIDSVSLPAVDALIDFQLADGAFSDPIRGETGQGGLTRLVWVALQQASRLSGEEAQERIRLARRSLSRGDEGEQLLPKWPLALIVEDGLQRYLVHPEPLVEKVAALGKLHASGIADACYQRTDGCFNNYRLTSEVLDLELARTGLHGPPGSRLAEPNLRARTLHWLGAKLPATTSETASVLAPGSAGGLHRAAALSDPDYYPLAYQAFCTAMLTRAAALAGSQLPAAARRLERAALWELVGMTAPDGEISWLGRGQDEVWTLAAALYAGVQGSELMAGRDPALAARLRRLAGVEFQALQTRLGPEGLRPKPNDDLSPAGLDGYASDVGNSSLALLWLELAREVAPAAVGAVAPLPAEVNGGSASDPRGDGLVTLRQGRIWMGVHRVSDDGDPRLGWGLLRALRELPGGRWVSLLPERPLASGGADPATGPLLVRGTAQSRPQTLGGGVNAGQIVLNGVWQGYAGSAPGRWAWAPSASGVRFTTTCPRGASLRFVEWFPGTGPLQRQGSRLKQGAFRVSFSTPVTVAALPGRWSSAREPHLEAYRVTARCTAASLSVLSSGSEIATG